MTAGAGLDPPTLHALATAALPGEQLTRDDIVTTCFEPGAEVLGDERGAAVVKLERYGTMGAAWLQFLAVHPDERGAGRGGALVDAAVSWARDRGALDVHLGAAIPRYLWPGVDFTCTETLALLEHRGFEFNGASFDMDVGTDFRSSPPAGVEVAREDTGGAVELARREYPNWVDEVDRGTERGTVFAARAAGETIAFAAHSVNRHDLIGPMATDPRHRGGGVGHALLAACCSDIGASSGAARARISWVGPLRFYAKAGAVVSRVYRNGRLPLRPPSPGELRALGAEA